MFKYLLAPLRIFSLYCEVKFPGQPCLELFCQPAVVEVREYRLGNIHGKLYHRQVAADILPDPPVLDFYGDGLPCATQASLMYLTK